MTQKNDKEIPLLVRLLKDMGFEAYDDGDRISGNYPTWAWEMAHDLIDKGWINRRKEK